MEGSSHMSQHPAVQSISHLSQQLTVLLADKLNNDTIVSPTPASAKFFLLHISPLEMYGNQIILKPPRLLSYWIDIQKLLQVGKQKKKQLHEPQSP